MQDPKARALLNAVSSETAPKLEFSGPGAQSFADMMDRMQREDDARNKAAIDAFFTDKVAD